MAASKVKTRSSDLSEESPLSFAKQMDGYIKNSTEFKAGIFVFRSILMASFVLGEFGLFFVAKLL